MKNLWTFAALVGMLGCSTARVHQAYDPTVDFSKYKTFCWLKGCEFEVTGPAYLQDATVRERVKTALVAVLEKKGMRYDDQSPDLMVGFQVAMQDEKLTVTENQSEDVVYSMGFPKMREVTLLSGTITVHLADRQLGAVVWQSNAHGYLEPSPDLSETNIRKGIKLALRHFPPRSRK
ncbi:MAG: DUF4136 domain-containing protein [Cyclobacteriaceae bacterium]|jgi:hypothetical protein